MANEYAYTPKVEGLALEIYRVSGLASGVSTPSTGPGGNPAAGNSVVIAGPYQSLGWRFNRQTVQDNGTGALASLEVNGLLYFPGSGPQYQEYGWDIGSSNEERIVTDVEFVAAGDAFAEIWVLR